jgi:hypothetical protein
VVSSLKLIQATSDANSDISNMAELSEKNTIDAKYFQQGVSEVLEISESVHIVVNTAAKNSFFRTVEMDHVVWKTNLYKTIFGLTGKSVDDFVDHIQCRLGKRYNEGDGKLLYAGTQSHQELE